MMKGETQEFQTGCATWDYVSKETFERFTQFAYTGDYSIPKMEKRNRVAMQREAVTDDSSPSTSNRIRRWDEAEADPNLVVEQPEPEPFDWNDFAGKKDTKKKGKSADLRPYWMVEPPAPTADADLEQGTVPITKRDKYPERYSHAHSDDFQSLTFPLLAPRNNHDKTCEPAEHFDPDQSFTEVFLSHASLYVLGDFKPRNPYYQPHCSTCPLPQPVHIYI
jgi:hypothetical protein